MGTKSFKKPTISILAIPPQLQAVNSLSAVIWSSVRKNFITENSVTDLLYNLLKSWIFK